MAEDREIHHVLETHRLMGRGLGWVDVHLLGAARLGDTELWTLDRTLFEAAQRIGPRLVR